GVCGPHTVPSRPLAADSFAAAFGVDARLDARIGVGAGAVLPVFDAGAEGPGGGAVRTAGRAAACQQRLFSEPGAEHCDECRIGASPLGNAARIVSGLRADGGGVWLSVGADVPGAASAL